MTVGRESNTYAARTYMRSIFEQEATQTSTDM